MGSILDFSKYTWKEWITFLVVIISFLFAIMSIYVFTKFSTESRATFFASSHHCTTLILILWACGPPAWFYAEYYLIWPDANDDKKERLKIGRELAKPFWAAVPATLIFLVPK